MSNCLLSITIPTYNRSKILEETLNSLLTQSFFPKDKIEIIISNDCSKDNTSQFVNEFIQRHSDFNIKFFDHKSNLGGAKNWQFCLEQASGEFIFLLSDDDTISSEFISEILRKIELIPDLDMIMAGMTFCDKDMNPLESIDLPTPNGLASGPERVKHQLSAHHMVMSTVYRRDLLLKAGGWDQIYGVHIDCSAFCLAALKASKTFYIDKPLFNYRILPGSWASFNVNKQKKEYSNYRKKIDALLTLAIDPELVNFLKLQYVQHAQSVLNNLELKFYCANISAADLRRTIDDLIDVYPEAKFSTAHLKLLAATYIGLGYLKMLRKFTGKRDPYINTNLHFETQK